MTSNKEGINESQRGESTQRPNGRQVLQMAGAGKRQFNDATRLDRTDDFGINGHGFVGQKESVIGGQRKTKRKNGGADDGCQ